jgi:tetratricopeptide (TPR) repeat protein
MRLWAALLCLLVPGVASATPSRWARVANPELDRAERVAAEAERDLILVNARRSPLDDALTPSTAYATRARMALIEAGAQRSSFARLRLLLARAEQQLHHFQEASLLFESVVKAASVPDAIKADAWADLAIVYARLKRIPEEVEAEEMAIALEPITRNRSLTLANQAEAFMGMGDISRAIAGYKAGLEGLTNLELATIGPTTFYSLGVALDRSGDLEGALEAVARARSYDPSDRFLRSDTWFFSSPHDESWYEALGHWMVGRRGDGDDVRLGGYERAVAAWKLYLAQAPESDPYVAVAKARLRQCEKELAAFSAKVSVPTPIDAPKRRKSAR